MDKKPKEVLADLERMVESDLMKANHYMKKGITIAVIAEEMDRAEKVAVIHVELTELLNRYQEIINAPASG